MRRILKWVGRVLGGLVVLILAAAVFIYVASERVLNRTYEVSLTSITAPTDSSSIAEGKRLATLRGCYNGCHGEQLEGEVFFDDPLIARVVAPNLTHVVTQYTDAELERVIRQGVKRDGTGVMAVMPAFMFHHLSDADLGAIIAFLRSVPALDGPSGGVQPGPLGRAIIALGQFPPAADMIDHAQPRLAASPESGAEAFGRYLATTLCTECHGMDLQGEPDGSTPNLVVAAAYSAEDFARLMRTGVPLGDRELDLMAEVARKRFSNLTDSEIEALHAYLKARAARDAGEADAPGT